ncbi:uncharacterized protein LOC131050909 [Cryptomeria japonica]|uniref:uncharacterized protein LOC131050909 n=1 Tax=Cryptomeria japonica TaxID=3369 RepID=UPI0027D9FF96|nr:uncharacterized protein LOC131050909 [Cryptomeria japonica]XP_059069495.1 uncharacterized protein LOC131050909 [Cryptomeria japonica]
MDSRLNDQDIWASVRILGLDRRIKHYSILQQILLVGEGDFSFSLTLANTFGCADNMVATSLDSREKIISSYESGQNNLQNLEKLGAMILHDVDATTMNKLQIIKKRRFDRIIFNFPHAGFFGNEKDNRVIKKHRHLLNVFFKNGMTMLNKMGEIHVTHKEQDPYDKWKLVEEAEKCGLLLKESVKFDKADYPGYTNRRGAGSRIGETFFLGECRTYMFILSSSCNDQIHSAQPKISLQGHLQILKAAILELESERRNRKTAEAAKAKLESSCNELRTVADEAFKERDKFRRTKDKALRKKKKIIKQLDEELDEALSLEEDAAMQRDESIRMLEFERKAKIDAEAAKANLEFSYNKLQTVVDKTLKERDEFKRQRDEALRERKHITEQLAESLRLKEEFERKRDIALHQKYQPWREKENISEQLAEALRFKDVVKERADVKKYFFVLLFLSILIYFCIFM